MSYSFPDREQQKPYEQGYPLPEAPPAENLPPGAGANVVPHFQTFGQIVNYASRVYRWTHDEALRDNWTNSLAIRRDPVIMDALRSRQLPTAQLAWHLECEDDQDSQQAKAVEVMTRAMERIPRFQMLKMHLLEALWFGRYGVQVAYSWEFHKGQKYLAVRDFKPINGDKLVFRFSGQPGVLVHQQFQGDYEQTDRGRAHFFNQYERDQLLIHRHEPEDADFFEPELGGSLQGVGIRGRIYWLWYLRSQVTAFLMDYLERIGAGGLTLYYYEAGSLSSADEVTQAVQNQYRNNAILFPRYRSGEKGGPGVERVEPSMAGAQLMQALVTQYFDDVMRRYILGQNLTTEAASTGLGSGLADLHGETFARYIKYDAVNLQDTLTEQLLHVLQKNSPFRHLPPLRFCFDVDKPNANETLAAAQAFFEMGGTVDEDQLRSLIGLEKPAPGASMLAKMGAMSPAAAGMMPTGVPMLGSPGPDMAQGGGMPPPEMPGPPQVEKLHAKRAATPLRYARTKRRAWNPFPYLRAIGQHFANDKSEMGRVIRALVPQALSGDKHAMMVLGDALQESSQPEWFQTILEHDLAWPPWKGVQQRDMRKPPPLERYVARKNDLDPSQLLVRRSTPSYRTGLDSPEWGGSHLGLATVRMNAEEFKALPGLKHYEDSDPDTGYPAPLLLSAQERALIDSPSREDIDQYKKTSRRSRTLNNG